jgi:hypothetical protein
VHDPAPVVGEHDEDKEQPTGESTP